MSTEATLNEPATRRLLYSRDEAATMLGIGLSQLDELVARGEIESDKIGRLRKFTHEDLVAYTKRLRGRAAS